MLWPGFEPGSPDVFDVRQKPQDASPRRENPE